MLQREVGPQALVARGDELQHCYACGQDCPEQTHCPDCEQPLEIFNACSAWIISSRMATVSSLKSG